MSWKQIRYRATFLLVDLNLLYVTYKGQTVTSRFCGETGHVQMNCEKRVLEFPKLSLTFYNQETDNMSKNQNLYKCMRKREMLWQILPHLFFRSACKFVKKKRKLLAEPPVDLPGEEIQSVRHFDKVCCSTPTLLTQQAVICDSNEIDLNDSLGQWFLNFFVCFTLLTKMIIRFTPNI